MDGVDHQLRDVELIGYDGILIFKSKREMLECEYRRKWGGGAKLEQNFCNLQIKIVRDLGPR